MASLRKVPGCNNWIACFTLPDGRRKQQSTGTPDRKTAQRIANEAEEATRKMRTARQFHRILSGIYAHVTGDALPTSTVRDYIAAWLKRKEPELSKSTNTFYRIKAKDFLEFLGARADLEMSRITQADVIGFRNKELERVSATSVNHSVKYLRMVFKSARADGVVLDNPAEFVGTVANRHRTKRRAFTLPELKLLLDHAGPEWRSMIYFGLYTGQRLGDIAALTWQNVDLAQKEIRLQTTKTERQQILPIAAPLLRHIMTLPSSDDPKAPLHPRAHEIVTREERVGSLSREFYEIMMDAGLAKKATHDKKENGFGRRGRHAVNEISFHALRHTATSLMKNAGISPAIVQEFIGHDSEAINRVYTHIETDAMRRAADALPDLISKAR
jgi:integrase